MIAKIGTIGMKTFEREIVEESFIPFNYNLHISNQDFSLRTVPHKEFIDPVFSVAQTMNCEKWSDARIVLISAVGAAGKSWLSDQLSYDLKCPKIDLGKMNVVASYSLTGILNKRLGARLAGEYIENLQQGRMGLIIDALDEGYQKTNISGYFDFLDDVIDKVPINSKTKPIIMLGRTNAIELAALHINLKGLSLAILTIEPFTIDKAKIFIDRRVGKEEAYDKMYQELRDYIINSIGCFFRNQSEISLQKTRFIGYAPVLLAIADYIRGIRNYQREINSLKQSNKRSISLIIDIIERILKRDKCQKIDNLLLKPIVEHRDKIFQERILREVYQSEEQCARVLYYMLDKQYNFSLIDDDDFKSRYETKIGDWIQEHPFLNGKKPANIVFESYILARLVILDQYKKDVYNYLSRHYNSSYIFFDIFHALNQGKNIDLQLVTYLYSSLNDLENREYKHSLDLSIDQQLGDGCLLLEADFEDMSGENENYQYSVIANENEEFKVGACLSNVNIDIPISISLCNPKTELTSPIYISCKSLIVHSEDLIVNSQAPESDIMIEATEVKSDTNSGILPNIKTFGNGEGLKIICDEHLKYPFLTYQSIDVYSNFRGFTDYEKEYYLKMRRLLIMFRSHSKGQLAKYSFKIDKRIGRTENGKPVLNALLNKHIIYKKDVMYYIDLDAMNNFLGVSFDSIKECVVNDKIRDFISTIKP